MGSEVKHLLALMQLGGSCISVLSGLYIFKEPGVGVFASSPRFHCRRGSGPGHPGAEGDARPDLQHLVSRPEVPVLIWRPANIR